MIDFSSLTNNLEGASITNVVVIALVSFVLSSLIALTYQKTQRELETPKYFIQSLILISIPVASVMQAIGDSLARGLGMLGALAIIRFRTTLRNPRNMVFMFTSIAIGISAGVYGITIAVIGTFAFCSMVFVIYYSNLGKTQIIIATLGFDISHELLIEGNSKMDIEQMISNYCEKETLSRYSVSNKKRKNSAFQLISLEYKIRVENKEKARSLADELLQINGVENVKVNFRDDYEKI